MTAAELAVIAELANCGTSSLGPYVIANTVRAALADIQIAQMRGDELARELAAARTYIRELERENGGSFW